MSKANPIIEELKRQRASQKHINIQYNQHEKKDKEEKFYDKNNKNNKHNIENLHQTHSSTHSPLRNKNKTNLKQIKKSYQRSPRNSHSNSRSISISNSKIRQKNSISPSNVKENNKKIKKQINSMNYLNQLSSGLQQEQRKQSTGIKPVNITRNLFNSKFAYACQPTSTALTNFNSLKPTNLIDSIIQHSSNPSFLDYIQFLQKQNKKYKQLVDKLMFNMKSKDQLLDECEQQIKNLKQIYEKQKINKINKQIKENIIIYHNKQIKDQNKEQQSKNKHQLQKNILKASLTFKQTGNNEVCFIQYTEDITQSNHLQKSTSENTFSQNNMQQRLQQQQLLPQRVQQSLQLSNSTNTINQTILPTHHYVTNYIPLLQSQSSIQSYCEHQLMLKAQGQIDSTRKDIHNLRERINNVMVRHNSLSSIKDHKQPGFSRKTGQDNLKLKTNIKNKQNLIYGGIVKNTIIEKGTQNRVMPMHRLMMKKVSATVGQAIFYGK